MQAVTPTVFLIDDDDAYRRSLKFLLEATGLKVKDFSSAELFLQRYDPEGHGCLLVDVRMPGLSGIELQSILNRKGASPPIIFITGHGDIPMSVRAIRDGAIDFIEKPFDDQVLIARIREAFRIDRIGRTNHASRDRFRSRIERLTNREREVMELIVEGLPNKDIATRLGVSHRTVEVHRSRIMNKMEAKSLVDLITSAVRHGIIPGSP